MIFAILLSANAIFWVGYDVGRPWKYSPDTVAHTDSIEYHPFYKIKIDSAGQCYMPVNCPRGEK